MQSGGAHSSSITSRSPSCSRSQTLHGGWWNAPDLVPTRALRQGSTFEQEATCTLMFRSKASNAPRSDASTSRSFPSNWDSTVTERDMNTQVTRVFGRRNTKVFCCQPEHTVRAILRVVATKPHFEGAKSTLSSPRSGTIQPSPG